jgi:hypothetical protein
MDVAASVERIFESLVALGRPVADRRRAGLSREEVATSFKEAGLYCHPDVVEAYAAADGTEGRSGDTIGDLSFFPGYYWLPLNEAFQTYEAVRSDEQWRDDWLPIFASGGGDFYAVVCSDREVAFGSMVGFILGETEQLIEFPSLAALLETVARCYERGAFRVSVNQLEADYAAFRGEAQQVSPDFKPRVAAAAA